MDTEMNFVVPPQYALTEKFFDGFALVRKWDKKSQPHPFLFVDRQGKELSFFRSGNGPQPTYEDVRDHADGIFRVSDTDMGGFWGFFSLAYHSYHYREAG